MRVYESCMRAYELCSAAATLPQFIDIGIAVVTAISIATWAERMVKYTGVGFTVPDLTAAPGERAACTLTSSPTRGGAHKPQYKQGNAKQLPF